MMSKKTKARLSVADVAAEFMELAAWRESLEATPRKTKHSLESLARIALRFGISFKDKGK